MNFSKKEVKMKFGHFDFLLRMFLLATGMAGIFGGLAMCEAKHVATGFVIMAALVAWCLTINKHVYERRRKARRAGEQD